MKKYAKYRFSKQIRKDDCGPNVILNLMKFNGVKLSYRASYKTLYDFFEIPVYGGTLYHRLDSYLTKSKIPNSRFVSHRFNCSMWETRELLRRNYSVILAFQRGPNQTGHVCLVVGSTKRGFQIVNFNDKKTIQTISFANFKKYVLDYKKANFFIFERKVSKNGKKTKSSSRR